MFETNCLWHCDSGHGTNCDSWFDDDDDDDNDGKNVVFVGKGDVNGDADDGISSIVDRFVRFDCRDLILLLRSLRSSEFDDWLFNDNCCDEDRWFPLVLARLPRLVLLIFLAS